MRKYMFLAAFILAGCGTVSPDVRYNDDSEYGVSYIGIKFKVDISELMDMNMTEKKEEGYELTRRN